MYTITYTITKNNIPAITTTPKLLLVADLKLSVIDENVFFEALATFVTCVLATFVSTDVFAGCAILLFKIIKRKIFIEFYQNN
jgi:hypothetical protein